MRIEEFWTAGFLTATTHQHKSKTKTRVVEGKFLFFFVGWLDFLIIYDFFVLRVNIQGWIFALELLMEGSKSSGRMPKMKKNPFSLPKMMKIFVSWNQKHLQPFFLFWEPLKKDFLGSVSSQGSPKKSNPLGGFQQRTHKQHPGVIFWGIIVCSIGSWKQGCYFLIRWLHPLCGICTFHWSAFDIWCWGRLNLYCCDSMFIHFFLLNVNYLHLKCIFLMHAAVVNIFWISLNQDLGGKAIFTHVSMD